MAVTISLISRKGGVGKTSLCVHLAGLLARDGCRVRVVDLDPQCSLSQFFLGAEAVENIHPRSTIDAVVTGRQTADQVQVPTRTHRLTLVPAHLGFEAPKKCAT